MIRSGLASHVQPGMDQIMGLFHEQPPVPSRRVADTLDSSSTYARFADVRTYYSGRAWLKRLAQVRFRMTLLSLPSPPTRLGLMNAFEATPRDNFIMIAFDYESRCRRALL